MVNLMDDKTGDMIDGLFGGSDTFILLFIDIISRIIEIFAVILIFGSVIRGSARYFLIQDSHTIDDLQKFTGFRQYLGQWLLLGLELLVAADVIRTVALDLTLERVAGLGLLVLVRTFLSWALVVEMEGRWPWQPAS
jgi:uncharacterized membrane protein